MSAKAWACVLGGKGRGEGTSISMGDFLVSRASGQLET